MRQIFPQTWWNSSTKLNLSGDDQYLHLEKGAKESLFNFLVPITFWYLLHESSFKTSNLSLFAHLTWFELSELASSEWPPLSANWIAAPISLQEISTGFVIARKYVDLPWKSAEISKTSKRPWPSAGSPNYYETDASPTRKTEGFSKGPSFQIDWEFILLCRSGFPTTSQKFSIVQYPTLSYIAGDWPRKTFQYTLDKFLVVLPDVDKKDAISGKPKPNMVLW